MEKKGYLSALLSLERDSNFQLEPLPKDLRSIRELLLNGDFKEVEKIFKKARNENPSVDLGEIPFEIKKQHFLELLSVKVKPFRILIKTQAL